MNRRRSTAHLGVRQNLRQYASDEPLEPGNDSARGGSCRGTASSPVRGRRLETSYRDGIDSRAQSLLHARGSAGQKRRQITSGSPVCKPAHGRNRGSMAQLVAQRPQIFQCAPSTSLKTPLMMRQAARRSTGNRCRARTGCSAIVRYCAAYCASGSVFQLQHVDLARSRSAGECSHSRSAFGNSRTACGTIDRS